MKTIALSELLSLLSDPSFVFTIGGNKTFLSLSPLSYRDEEKFAYIAWTDIKGRAYATNFLEGVNRQIKTENNSIHLIDENNEIVVIEYKKK